METKKEKRNTSRNLIARHGESSGRVLAEYEIKSFAPASSFQRGDSERQPRLPNLSIQGEKSAHCSKLPILPRIHFFAPARHLRPLFINA
ncbi:hypothetical protein CEXT_435081 [Caerostris extrusa]|uniref:Uncharacterized protein n=1 Tax=Caerostris extrusa TaxID=172846 RepID=A0AAV4RST0_CAEEX|nr:hypothetical protein CEXT_435081 [Caerostris extrusa]